MNGGRYLGRERRHAGRSRDASTREKLHGFCGKIKRERKIYGDVYYRHDPATLTRYPCSTLSDRSILRNAILLRYPSPCGQAGLTHWPQTWRWIVRVARTWFGYFYYSPHSICGFLNLKISQKTCFLFNN